MTGSAARIAPLWGRWAAFWLGVGLLLRLLVALPGDPLAAYNAPGGDTAWYLANGEGLLSGQSSGYTRFGFPFYNEVLPTPPLYLLFVGAWQRIASPEAAIYGIRISQALLSLMTAWLAAHLALRITRQRRAGLFVLAVLCLDPAQWIEPAQINTETLYIALIMAGLWAFMAGLADAPRPSWRAAILCGALLGLATLTRAVGLLFPLALVALGLLAARQPRAGWAKAVAALLVAYICTVGTWTVYNALAHNRLVVASTQLMPAIWRGAVSNDGSPQENDALLLPAVPTPENCQQDCKVQVPSQVYVDQTAQVIFSDPLAYVTSRLREWAGSVAQPHTTILLAGESLRDLAAAWAADGLSLAGLQRLLAGDNFLLKLALYVFQYVGYGLALVGVWRSRANWPAAAVPLAFVGYTLAIHVVLLALPRYIFPIMPCIWALAGAALWRPKPAAEAP
jgi:4-amino-4-deoxy-L-arabinose transferase-like glycosyltransferase